MSFWKKLSIKNIGKGIKSIGSGVGSFVKKAVPKALPIIGGAVGTLIAPGIGTAIGSKLGSFAKSSIDANQVRQQQKGVINNHNAEVRRQQVEQDKLQAQYDREYEEALRKQQEYAKQSSSNISNISFLPKNLSVGQSVNSVYNKTPFNNSSTTMNTAKKDNSDFMLIGLGVGALLFGKKLKLW